MHVLTLFASWFRCIACAPSTAHEGIEHRIATEGEQFDEPVRKLFREHGKVHRPVSEEVHLSAVAVENGVMALQGGGGCMGFGS